LSTAKERLFKILKITGKVFLGILIFIILLLLFIRSPWGQNIIKDQFISSVEKKTGANIELEKLFIEFNGDIQIDKLYIEDPQGDTIAYSESISANIGIWPLIKGNSFSLNELDVQTLKANVIRKDSVAGFNYEFLLNAYASDTTQTTTPADTSAAPMDIQIEDINLDKIDVVYRDDVSGIDTKIKFDLLELEFTETDLQNMVFKVNDAILSNANIQYEQTKPFPETDSEPPPMPVFEVANLELTNIRGSYNSIPDSLNTKFRIADLNVENSTFNLKDNIINSNSIVLANSEIELKMQQKTSATTDDSNKPEESTAFQWPEWNINIAKIDLDQNTFNYSVNNAKVEKGVFNPNAIEMDNLVFQAKDILYKEGEASAEIEKIQFKEGSGIDLNKFNLQAMVTNEQMEFSNLDVAVNNNNLSGNMNLSYASLDNFIENPETASLNLNLDNIYLNIKEVYRFQPELKKNEYMQALASSPVRGNLNASGKLDNIDLQSLNINWSNTKISGNGRILNAQDPENLSFDLPGVQLSSNRTDLIKFVKEEDIGLKLPETVSLRGSFAGNMSEIKTNSVLITSDGSLDIDGAFEIGDQIAFDAEIQADSIALGSLLQNEALGDLQLNIKASGKGSTVNDINASLDSRISSFSYNGYEFRNIDITGDLENGQGPVNLIYEDSNLNMELQTKIKLDSVSPRFDFNLFMDGADLAALGITQKEIKTGFTLEGWFEGNANAFEAKAEIIDGVAVYNNKTYLLGNLNASAFVREDTTSVNVDNRILAMDLQSNATPLAFSNAINRHFKRYITENYEEDSVVNPVNLKLNATLTDAPIINEVFLVNLEEMDTVDINVDFREAAREMDASISVPYVNIFSSQIDSLKIDMQ